MPPAVSDRRRDRLVYASLALLIIGYAILGFWGKYFGSL